MSVALLFHYLFFVISVKGLELPGSCKSGQYYDPDLMDCQSCPANISVVTSPDGFACTCEGNSILTGVAGCRPCNVTEVVSSDGRACVPRRCQKSSGGIVCRKCPNDYISVTQNFDGSPMKEVLCVKCGRGYKADNNICVRCDSCACSRSEIVVRGKCISKRFVNDRPKYDGTKIHPVALLNIVKYEFLCTQSDVRACRTLASECVKNFYYTDLAGPCRFWIQPKIDQPKGLPHLTIESTTRDKYPGEITLTRGMDTLHLVVAMHTSTGALTFLQDANQKPFPCLLPLEIKIGADFSSDCHMNISQLESLDINDTLAPFLHLNGDLKPIPVSTRKPNGNYVQKGTWSTSKLRRYFVMVNSLSTTTNVTNTVYLRTLLIRLRVERDKYKSSSLRLRISIEAQYASKSVLSQSITMSLKVENEMPSAGVLRGLEIWGGVLCALLALYAVVQWRGVMRRGGHYIGLFPLLAGSVADALYFAALLSTIHALAAEAGTLGMTLPLSRSEEHIIKAFVFSAVSLKTVKVAWFNWHQCRCDIFLLDWSEYNPPLKETTVIDKPNWKANTLAREWSMMQTKRRASPGFTVTLVIIILHLMTSWQSYLPQSRGYQWAVATLAWWAAYVTILTARWILDRAIGPPTAVLPKVCSGVGLSLLVFQEEYFAHYVHGRNDDSDTRTMAGPLAACRVVCAPQLRTVYKKLSTPGMVDLGESDTKQALLSRFLAAFFERALDGLSWVASERTIPERLLDVELTARENGNTSALLYDPDDVNTPSCFLLTWWGEEWSLGTFDAMLFGCIFITTENSLMAALVTLVVWQVMKNIRSWFGIKNLKEKIDIY